MKRWFAVLMLMLVLVGLSFAPAAITVLVPDGAVTVSLVAPASADEGGSSFTVENVFWWIMYYYSLNVCYLDALGTPVAVDCGPSSPPSGP